MVNFEDQRVKGQDHTRPKIDLDPGESIIFDPFGSSRFYSK